MAEARPAWARQIVEKCVALLSEGGPAKRGGDEARCVIMYAMPP